MSQIHCNRWKRDHTSNHPNFSVAHYHRMFFFVVKIYFHNNTHPVDYLTSTGKDERPFLLSRGPLLYIKFETGEDLYSIPYVGFRAFYQFVKGKQYFIVEWNRPKCMFTVSQKIGNTE